MKKILMRLGVSLMIVVSPFVAYEVAKSMVFSPGTPDADYPKPGSVIEARQQDLDYFRHFLDLDRSYSADASKRASELTDKIERRLPEMSEAEFWVGISEAVAMAENGHSNVWSGRRAKQFGRIPIRGYWFADGFYILRAKQELADLLGSKITRIDGKPMSSILEQTGRLVGGSAQHKLDFSPFVFEVPALLHALGATEEPDSYTLTVEYPDGSTADRLVSAPMPDPENDPHNFPWKQLSPDPLPLENDEWLTLLAIDAALPRYLRDMSRIFMHGPLSGVNGYYIQYRANNDSDSEDIAEFQDDVSKALLEIKPRVIVVDQRFNGGGDYTKTMDFMRELISYVPADGRLYFLTGRATFSAGINSVAFAKSEAGERMRIVGTRIGDGERSWGETNRFVLPNSKLGIIFSTGLHDVENGCTDWKICYWTDIFNNVAVGRLDPDIEVRFSFSDYLALRDPVLEKIIELEQG